MNTFEQGVKIPCKVTVREFDGSDPLSTLNNYLNTLPPGPIADTAAVTLLLIKAWDGLDGSDEGGMKWEKLTRGRCEDLTWSPPMLSFAIERHGATVFGSSRAEIQYWNINSSNGQAWIMRKGVRQLYPMSKRLDVAPLAETVAREIESGAKSESLKWNSDGTVRVFVSKIIPKTYAQTTIARRKRFRLQLVDRMAAAGWKEVKLHVYKRVVAETGSS